MLIAAIFVGSIIVGYQKQRDLLRLVLTHSSKLPRVRLDSPGVFLWKIAMALGIDWIGGKPAADALPVVIHLKELRNFLRLFTLHSIGSTGSSSSGKTNVRGSSGYLMVVAERFDLVTSEAWSKVLSRALGSEITVVSRNAEGE